MNATEFSKLYPCDADWIVAMGDRQAIELKQGQRGTWGGLDATVMRHYRNCGYELSVPGGQTLADASEFVPS